MSILAFMRVLGIETSCDETAAAVVEDGYNLLSNVVASSVDLHAAYGGVVPEIAARSHIESILPVIQQALDDAFASTALSSQHLATSKKEEKLSVNGYTLTAGFDPWDQIDAIAVTQGPGLIGSLLIGVLTARTLAIAKNKPLYAINHVQAHPYACFITETGDRSKIKDQRSISPIKAKYALPKRQPQFPMLALIVSGGHTQLALFKNHFDYKLLGQTTDDAAGEAFDKVAKMLGLPYPGGPSIAKAAKRGNSKALKLPKAQFNNVIGLTYHKTYHKLPSDYRFSFSGLKTAVLRAAQELSGHDYTFPSSRLPQALSATQKANIAASFQDTIVKTLLDKLEAAVQQYRPKSIIIAGGVAANQELRDQASKMLSSLPTNSRDPEHSQKTIFYPDIKLCTDNAAMIAALGYFQAKSTQKSADPYSIEVKPSLSM